MAGGGATGIYESKDPGLIQSFPSQNWWCELSPLEALKCDFASFLVKCVPNDNLKNAQYEL